MKGSIEASFGEVLRQLRERKHFSRKTLGTKIGVHQRTIENWERGDVLPDRARVDDLIKALALLDAERVLFLEAYQGLRVLPSLHNLPFFQNRYFTGREEILQQLHQQLVPGRQLAIKQTISGLGGVGKTQVALEYVYRHQRDYQHVLWARADSYESLISEFGKLAEHLDLPEKKEKDQNRVVAAMQRWIREYVNWLLIFDNVEDLNLVTSFIPPEHLGCVLLTTRMQVTEEIAPVLALDCMTEEEGALLLLRRTKLVVPDALLDAASHDERLQAQAISQVLGGLPLALDQAGAYILETGCALANYLPLYEQRHAVLLARRSSVPSDHPESVSTTFSLAFERVQQKNSALVDLLRLCAFLAPDAIPEELITGGTAHLESMLQPVVADPFAFNEAMEILRTLSLIQRSASGKTLSLHRLVQTVLKDEMSEASQREWIERCIRLLDQTFPDQSHPSDRMIVEQRRWCEQLVPHVLAIVAVRTPWEISSPEAASLFYKTARYLSDRAQYGKAEPLFQRALYIQEQVFGPDHLHVADSLNYLAILYFQQGEYEQAAPLFQRALRIREQVFGPDHPHMADSLNNLAGFYFQQGEYEQAESLLQRTLHIREQVFGPDHPQVAISLTNLAELYREQGKYEQAEPLYQRTLSIQELALGPEHTLTAFSLDGLAALYHKRREYEQAEPLFQRALRIREQVFGPDHPHVASTLNYLAELYKEQGKYEQAEPLFQRALRIREQALGPDHPHVAISLNGLATIYREQGKYEQAEPLYLRVLTLREQHPRLQHPPETAETLHDLAVFYHYQGHLTKAEPLYQRAIAIREQLLGLQHPDTQATLTRYAALLRATGRTDEAAALEAGLTKRKDEGTTSD